MDLGLNVVHEPGDRAGRGTGTDAAPEVPAPVARIGPNAITRLAEAIGQLHGPDAGRGCFEQAGLSRYLDVPPGDMVDEAEVIALHRVCRARFGTAGFAEIARVAGSLTGDYVLAYRIPRFAKALLRALPAALAGRLLARAIAAHAWTFVGSGTFAFQARRGGLMLRIHDSPLARGERSEVPQCDFYAATFERIFRRLVDRRTTVVEIGCAATGARCCSFDVRFDATPAP